MVCLQNLYKCILFRLQRSLGKAGEYFLKFKALQILASEGQALIIFKSKPLESVQHVLYLCLLSL